MMTYKTDAVWFNPSTGVYIRAQAAGSADRAARIAEESPSWRLLGELKVGSYPKPLALNDPLVLAQVLVPNEPT